jgi:hypothetical protein
MHVVGVILVVLIALIVVASLVEVIRRKGSWPRKPHLGNWQKWDDED